MIKQETDYGKKILIGEWRAQEIIHALEKILTTKNVMSDTLNCGEVNVLKELLTCLKEK